MELSPAQIETFQNEGLLCIPDFLTAHDVQRLMAESHRLLGALDLDSHPKTQFKTGESDHVGDHYFFDSADKVSYFFDTDAFGPDGQLRFPKEKSVNKIGHGLHIHNGVFRDVTFGPRVQNIARDLHYTDPRVLQSMLICKNPKPDSANQGSARDNEVPSHTDATFLYTEPQSAIGYWFALEDCTVLNGCLSYSPGTHHTVPITKRFARVDGEKKGCSFLDVDHGAVPESIPDFKAVECKAGLLILIHNSVLHKSEKNVLDKSRFAYAFHVIDGTATYDALNWLQIPSSGGTNFLKLYEGEGSSPSTF